MFKTVQKLDGMAVVAVRQNTASAFADALDWFAHITKLVNGVGRVGR
jgi:hypothetical protein